jgi:Tfp pilus assembly protein PilF
MVPVLKSLYRAGLFSLSASALLLAQNSKPKATVAAPSPEQGLHLAEKGHCAEALPILKKAAAAPQADSATKRNVGIATIRCAMTVDNRDMVLDAIKSLKHSFPDDPEVLYITTHAYSDLSSRESLDLARKAPDSSQAHELQAEALEAQGKWEAAAREYRLMLDRFPNQPGIHFRLGRVLLSQPNPPADMAQQAQKEFEEELKINPNNAGAEYILGEIAQQSETWDVAEQHYSRAAQLDPTFGDAFLRLGISRVSLKRYADAIAPLETAVKLEPDNPNAHYQLATAYTRSGRKQDGEKEFAIHKRLIEAQPAPGEAPVPLPQGDAKN